MFESLSERLNAVFRRIQGRGKLSEDDVNEALREVRRALLEADVSLPVVKEFIAHIRERAVGEELIKSMTPAQQVIKYVRDELIALMGEETARLSFAGKGTSIFMEVSFLSERFWPSAPTSSHRCLPPGGRSAAGGFGPSNQCSRL